MIIDDTKITVDNPTPAKQSMPRSAIDGVITQLQSKQAFMAGVITTSGIMFALGFIILAVMMFKGLTFSSGSL